MAWMENHCACLIHEKNKCFSCSLIHVNNLDDITVLEYVLTEKTIDGQTQPRKEIQINIFLSRILAEFPEYQLSDSKVAIHFEIHLLLWKQYDLWKRKGLMVPTSALQIAIANALNIFKHLIYVKNHMEIHWNFASCKYILTAIKRLVNNRKLKSSIQMSPPH